VTFPGGDPIDIPLLGDTWSQGEDEFQEIVGRITWDRCENSGMFLGKTITVAVNGDTTAESAEVFYVNLSGAVNATIADGQGAASITNDDASSSPSLSINSVSLV
jgi:hypothetical protein